MTAEEWEHIEVRGGEGDTVSVTAHLWRGRNTWKNQQKAH